MPLKRRLRRALRPQVGYLCAVVGALSVMGLSGCGSLGVDGGLGAAQIRFVQVSPGAPDLDFYVNGSGVAYNLGFASFTSYLPVSPGGVSLTVTKAGGGQAIGSAQGLVSGGRQYTAVLSHGLGNLQERVYQDQDMPAPQGQIALRVIDEVEGVGGVSVYVVPAGVGVVGLAPAAVWSVGSGAASGYVNLPANGSYTVTATVAEGALNVPVGSVSLKAGAGAVRTVVFAGTAGTAQSVGRGVVGFALEDVDAP